MKRNQLGKLLAIGFLGLGFVGAMTAVIRPWEAGEVEPEVAKAVSQGLRPVLYMRQHSRVGRNWTVEFRRGLEELNSDLPLINQGGVERASFPSPPPPGGHLDLNSTAAHVSEIRRWLDEERDELAQSVKVLENVGRFAARVDDKPRFEAVIETLGRICAYAVLDESLVGYELLATAKRTQLSLLWQFGAEFRYSPAQVDRWATQGLPPEQSVIRAFLEGYIDESTWNQERRLVFGPGVSVGWQESPVTYPTEPGVPTDNVLRRPFARALKKVNPLWAQYLKDGDEATVLREVMADSAGGPVATREVKVARLSSAVKVLDVTSEADALVLAARYRPDWGAAPLGIAPVVGEAGFARVEIQTAQAQVKRRGYHLPPYPRRFPASIVTESVFGSWPVPAGVTP